MIERRRYERVPFHTRASVTIPGEPSIEAWTIDLSLGGVRLASGCLFRAGQLLIIAFHLRDEAQREVTEQVTGVVMFARSESEGYSFGVEFTEPIRDATAPVLVRRLSRI